MGGPRFEFAGLILALGSPSSFSGASIVPSQSGNCMFAWGIGSHKQRKLAAPVVSDHEIECVCGSVIPGLSYVTQARARAHTHTGPIFDLRSAVA